MKKGSRKRHDPLWSIPWRCNVVVSVIMVAAQVLKSLDDLGKFAIWWNLQASSPPGCRIEIRWSRVPKRNTTGLFGILYVYTSSTRSQHHFLYIIPPELHSFDIICFSLILNSSQLNLLTPQQNTPCLSFQNVRKIPIQPGGGNVLASMIE